LRPVIGIVGGVGPHAGYDLALKILEETDASSDQEHIPVIMISDGDVIPDRTAYLEGSEKRNPADPIADVLRRLGNAGATAAGIPCNTAHATRIFQEIEAKNAAASGPSLVNMVVETGRYVRHTRPGLSTVGLLSTLGTARSQVYQNGFKDLGIGVVLPDEDTQRHVHAAIYDPSFGIKACSQPVSNEATEILTKALMGFASSGITTVILGCTEIPLALPVPEWNGITLIDATRVLARALIRETYPEKLKRSRQ